MADVKTRQARRGVTVSARGLTFTVKDANTGQDKTILSNVSATCAPGRLLAIMGASGAGKTTLLDILACNVYAGSLQGEVLVDSAPRDARSFLQTSCYVMQKDLLYASATVRECITTSALLRLPMSMPRAAKLERVEEIIKELELERCADTLIGDEVLGIKGISGGQKRRVSLAIEMVKDPAIIFADEPTSGLDSEVALSIMDALHMLSRKSRTVVCTIHQPNSDLTDLFDDFLLLASGRAVYGGPWRGAVDWFALQGHVCPSYKNPTDYFMSVVKRDDVAYRLADAFESHSKHCALAAARGTGAAAEEGAGAQAGASLAAEAGLGAVAGVDSAAGAVAGAGAWAGAGAGASTAAGAAAAAAAGGATAGATADGAPYMSLEIGDATDSPYGDAQDDASGVLVASKNGAAAGFGAGFRGAQVASRGPWHRRVASSGAGDAAEHAPWWYQTAVLYQRTMRNWLRSPIMLASEFVQYAVISVFVGLMYYKVTDDADGIYNRAACIWFAFAVMSFTPSYTAVTSWHSERLLVSRELKQRQYGITPMYLSRTLVLLPAQVMQCLVFVAVMYFFVGFQPSAHLFFIFWIVLSMFQLISEGLGLLCAVVATHATYAVIMLTFILLLLLSFSGFLMTKIPVYFIWVNKLSYLTYAYTALMQSQLEGLMVSSPADPNAMVDAITLLPPVLQNGLTMAQNIGVLVSQWAFMEALKLATLYIAQYAGLV